MIGWIANPYETETLILKALFNLHKQDNAQVFKRALSDNLHLPLSRAIIHRFVTQSRNSLLLYQKILQKSQYIWPQASLYKAPKVLYKIQKLDRF